MGARASATTIDVDEIVALAGRLDSDELAPADRARAKALLLLFADIIAFVSRKSASIRSLRASLFGAAAGRTTEVLRVNAYSYGRRTWRASLVDRR